ncbi:hypothetical protein K525DRAFT_257671 [Schizophyllum commune Loenen D]|nr:hypothetical protein K525DRAFT_257671 [Schizophyllum commune Loenen D]
MSQQLHKTRRPASLPVMTPHALTRHAQSVAINHALRGANEGIGSLQMRTGFSNDPSNADHFRPRYARMDLYDDPLIPVTVAVLEVPGVRREDLHLRIDRGILHVVGRRRPRYRLNQPSLPGQPAVDGPPVAFHTQDLYYGIFRRQIRLPHGCTPEDVSTQLADGHLTLWWPRVVNRRPAEAQTQTAVAITDSCVEAEAEVPQASEQGEGEEAAADPEPKATAPEPEPAEPDEATLVDSQGVIAATG